MSIMIEEETNNYSLVAVLQPHLLPVPSNNPPLPPPPVIITTPNIAADDVGTLADAFLDLSNKVKLDSILNRK